MANYQFPWNQVNTLVQDFIMPFIRDQFFLGNAFYYRAKNRLKTYTGGRAIVQPLSWKAEGGGGYWFQGVDRLNTDIRDPIQAATWTAKNAYVPIAIDWESEMQVSGPEMVKSLVESKMEIAKNTAIDLIGTDLFNDGSNQKAVTGLQYALKDGTGAAPGVPPTMTYAGISRSATANTWWNHNVDNTAYTTGTGGTFTADNFKALSAMWANIRLRSGKSPTLILSNVGSQADFIAALVKNERYVRPQQNSELAKASFENVMFKSAAWVVDERAPRTTDANKIEKVYLINEDAMRLCVDSRANMKFEPFRIPYDQMARVAYILWRGEIIIIEPRACGVISSVNTSAVS